MTDPDAVARVDAAIKSGKDKDEIDRLAKLDDLSFMRERVEASKKLGIKVSDLNELVKKVRRAVGPQGSDDDDDDAMAGRPVEFDDPEPCAEAVAGPALLSGLSDAIRSYVILGAVESDTLALWSVFTHTFDAFDVAPKINLSSVEKRCGKSRLVDVMGRVVAHRLLVSGGSAAALMRVIEKYGPTILLDEIDVLLKRSPELREAVRGLLNAGFNRSGSDIILNVPSPSGGYEPRLFSAFAPQILSGIGDLPDTVRDRSIAIELKRKKRDEKIRRLRRRDGGDLRQLCSMAVRWAADNIKALHSADPDMPSSLDDRAADAWEPLISIADLAGGEWPDRARRAAVKLSGSRGEEGDSIGTMLLADIRTVFSGLKTVETDRIESERLAAGLAELEGRPWAEWGKTSKPMSKNQLARQLDKFQIKPGTVRFKGRDPPTTKGYIKSAFEDAFARYLPPALSEGGLPPAIQTVTTSQTNSDGAFDDFQNVTTGTVFRFENAQKPNNDGRCDVVTFQTGGSEPPQRKGGEQGPNGPYAGGVSAAGATTTPCSPTSDVAGIPLQITRKIREQLTGLGYTAEQVANLTPAQGRALLLRGDRPGANAPPPQCVHCGGIGVISEEGEGGEDELESYPKSSGGRVLLHPRCQAPWAEAMARAASLALRSSRAPSRS